MAQPCDRLDQIVALGGQRGVLRFDLAQLLLGAQVDGAEPFAVRRGMRIAQLVVAPFARVALEESGSLDGTVRAGGGFGSTGA